MFCNTSSHPAVPLHMHLNIFPLHFCDYPALRLFKNSAEHHGHTSRCSAVTTCISGFMMPCTVGTLSENDKISDQE